ncbi:hypothetical protein K4Q72_12000 [Staphylococcus epidermidis]|uniref:hypothetical protein n=1 Tax=Staphylococcus epidermidis TaxID=1282 RepID=UPI0011A88A9E|nr:hypothetical protein [Staphylococcus epidermidis]MCG1589768.1 hypothetical protein [Staphylococcus epidermidis]HDE6879224.1 hypothetical protein [Staphylococcus aureus]
MKNILVLKLSDKHLDSNEKVDERATGNWKISPKRLDDVKYVFVLKNNKVVETYELGDEFIYNRSTGRVSGLKLSKNNDLDAKGKEVIYPTSNPATLASLKTLGLN